jgi:hypothetical protein
MGLSPEVTSQLDEAQPWPFLSWVLLAPGGIRVRRSWELVLSKKRTLGAQPWGKVHCSLISPAPAPAAHSTDLQDS